MAVITTATLIVAGGLALIGTGGAIWYACTEDDRARERIKVLQAENQQIINARDYVSGVETKLVSAKDYLTHAKNDFKSGGHVLDGVPLANTEFTSCITKLEDAIDHAENLINDFNATISYNNSEIQKEQAKLD